MDQYELAAQRMVEEQIIARGVKMESVLDAMRSVPRHRFIPEHLHTNAYNDLPLPIGYGQTISQPYIVAFMTEQLMPAAGARVLEIGTGSGYQAAILAYLGCEIYTIEFVEELAARAQATFAALGFDTIKAKHGNGYMGWPEEAPFDAIIVTAAPDNIPQELVKQLADGGKMVIPVGSQYSVQWLKLLQKTDGRMTEDDLLPVSFVPMVSGGGGLE